MSIIPIDNVAKGIPGESLPRQAVRAKNQESQCRTDSLLIDTEWKK